MIRRRLATTAFAAISPSLNTEVVESVLTNSRTRPRRSISTHTWTTRRRHRSTTTASKTESTPSTEEKPPKPTSTVVLVRHGQSTWNKVPTFSGWCDVPLTDKGIEQAAETGKLLADTKYHHNYSKNKNSNGRSTEQQQQQQQPKSRSFDFDFDFDFCYTSTLQRAYRTAEVVLETMHHEQEQRHTGDHHDSNPTPLIKAWQLNERHYGELQGQAKSSPHLHQRYGTEQITSWRRDMHARPPPMTEVHPYYEDPPAPLTESLYDSQQRVLQYWHETIVPSMRRRRKKATDADDHSGLNRTTTTTTTTTGNRSNSILIVAHANTIRGLVASLDGIADPDVPKIHIPNSVPYVFEIDPETGQAVSTNDSPLSISKGQWILSSQNQERLLDKLGADSEAFARSVFHAWDINGDGILSRKELTMGLSAWKRDPNPAINALAGKVWEELMTLESTTRNSGGVTMEMLQHVTLAGCRKHNLPFFEDEEVVGEMQEQRQELLRYEQVMG